MTNQFALLVLSNPIQGREQEFNDWYDRVHVPDLLKIPGVAQAQRYEVMPAQDSPHRYLAVYDIDGDPTDVLAELNRRVGAGEVSISESLDLTTVQTTLWRPRA